MKKAICILLLTAMLLSVLTACDSGVPSTGNQQNGSQQNGSQLSTDPASAVRLLLAAERLNAALLKNEGDIFEQGAETMRSLAKMTTQSMQKTGQTNLNHFAATVKPMSTTRSSEVVYDGSKFGDDFGGVVTFDGEKYMFSDYTEVSNSYSYFSETANAISSMAEEAANLIDYIKKNVRIVDKWLSFYGEEYYLHVGENEEVLYSRNVGRSTVCRRYLNADGLNVYEYYQTNGDFYNRMVYIPGVHFEMISGDSNPRSGNYMIADNTKGYWESYCVGEAPNHYNVSYMVMKDDICYDSFYNPKEGLIQYLKVISADKKTDLFDYAASEYDNYVIIDAHFAGLDGIAYIEADASNVTMTEMGGEVGYVPMIQGYEAARLVTTGGKVIKAGDTFLDGKIEIETVRQNFTYPHLTGSLTIRIYGGNMARNLELYQAFLEEVGLTCRRNIRTVLPGVRRAYDELKEITRYHTWNGYMQATEEDIAAAITAENDETAIMKALIRQVQNAEVIDCSDQTVVELNAHFAPVTVASSGNVVQSGTTVNVGNVTLSVTDTLLFLEQEAYTVRFALSGPEGLVHLKAAGTEQTTAYKKGNEFSLSVSDVTLELPALTDGSYTLVAFISTADGIRSSGYTPLPVDTVDTETNVTLTRSRMTVEKGNNGALVVRYTLITDLFTEIAPEQPVDYQAFYEMLASFVCAYGIPGEGIEVLTGEDTYTALTGQETEILSGTYRLAYTIENGEKQVSGYLFVEFTQYAEVPTE